MAIKQSIEYNSKNRYFAGFLQDIIKQSQVRGSVSQNDGSITLLLDDTNEKALSEFSRFTNLHLPHSIFLGDIKSSYEDVEISDVKFTSPTYDISLCPRCLRMLNDPASQRYLDDSIRCDHYSNTSDNYFLDTTTFSAYYSKGDTLLVVDTLKVNDLFIMTEDEIKALFSIEKPTLKVTIKDETLKEITKKKFINIRSAYNVRSTLVALNAKEGGVPYLFFKEKKPLKAVVVQKNITIVKDAKGITDKLEDLDVQADMNRFLNISKEAGFEEGSIGAYLSLEHGISFMVSNEAKSKRVLKLQPFVLNEVIELMENDEIKSKLLLNFEKKYPFIAKALLTNPNFDMFETIACILELKDMSFEGVSDKSLEFRGNGGLKIDTYFGDDGFDYVSFLGSIMSFKLAGTDDHYLAYSIFEAIGDMVIATLNQLKTKFKIYDFVMMGGMFENSILYSRILSRFQLSNPYFSKSFALDD